MKKYLLIAFLVTGACFAQAQTKGTNTIGLGIGVQKQRVEFLSSVRDEQTTGISLSYGHFIKENDKMGIDLFYGNSKLNSTPQDDFSANNYGVKLTYQRYFRLIKTFYAFGGGRGQYYHSEGNFQQEVYLSQFSTDGSSLGVYGGVSWFLSKRFSLEADLLSADIGYNKTNNRSSTTTSTFHNTAENFNLNSAGAINSLGFKIHFLF